VKMLRDIKAIYDTLRTTTGLWNVFAFD